MKVRWNCQISQVFLHQDLTWKSLTLFAMQVYCCYFPPRKSLAYFHCCTFDPNISLVPTCLPDFLSVGYRRRHAACFSLTIFYLFLVKSKLYISFTYCILKREPHSIPNCVHSSGLPQTCDFFWYNILNARITPVTSILECQGLCHLVHKTKQCSDTLAGVELLHQMP